MVENLPANTRDMETQIGPCVGKTPGVGNGNPLQYSCLENSIDRGAWRAPVHWGGKELDTTE